ncbi:hypothetical protein LCGC14_0856890 [marine sediment metagenome]|uniref:Uncharacterized protein n=1 Tax=marine sediment metagenome TaxID=412755 RepID=A0A0F9SFN3_9ZZZZ
MIHLEEALSAYNKKHKLSLTVENVDNSYRFYTKREKQVVKVGEIELIRNRSNCGVIDLHSLWGNTPKDIDLILSFMKDFAKVGGRNILTYNTSSDQPELRKSLKKAGFSSPRTKYKNKNSGNFITFHVLAVK